VAGTSDITTGYAYPISKFGRQIFRVLGKKSTLNRMDTKLYIFLLTVTLVQVWWIAVWGITDIGIRLVAGKHKFIEVLIYILFMVTVVAFLGANPDYMIHL